VNTPPFVPVALARILRPWGRRGEVAAYILTDFPLRLAQIPQVWLADGRNPPRPARVLSCRVHLGQAILQFAGIGSISEAERLRGLEVQIPLAERLPLGPGRYYITDLIGCEVWEPGGSKVGTVRDVQRAGPATHDRSPEAWVLAVTTDRGELLIPLAVEICTEIDIQNRRIEVRLPQGLRDLNGP